MTLLAAALVLGPAPAWELGAGLIYGGDYWQGGPLPTLHARRGI
ncbi:MAG: hypothetical protein ACI9VR_000044, partial [Cognaticolwellia sp.]